MEYQRPSSGGRQAARVGLAWPVEEEPRRSRSRVPPVIQDSFVSSPDRRRLVSELRAQVRQQQYEKASPLTATTSPSKRQQQQDFSPPQQQQQQRNNGAFALRGSRQLTTEQVAAFELEELERTTLSLRKLQTDFKDLAMALKPPQREHLPEEVPKRTSSGRFQTTPVIPASSLPLVPVVETQDSTLRIADSPPAAGAMPAPVNVAPQPSGYPQQQQQFSPPPYYMYPYGQQQSPYYPPYYAPGFTPPPTYAYPMYPPPPPQMYAQPQHPTAEAPVQAPAPQSFVAPMAPVAVRAVVAPVEVQAAASAPVEVQPAVATAPVEVQAPASAPVEVQAPATAPVKVQPAPSPVAVQAASVEVQPTAVAAVPVTEAKPAVDEAQPPPVVVVHEQQLAPVIVVASPPVEPTAEVQPVEANGVTLHDDEEDDDDAPIWGPPPTFVAEPTLAFAAPAHIPASELENEVAKRREAAKQLADEAQEESAGARKRREILARKRAEEEAALQHRTVVIQPPPAAPPDSPKIGTARTLEVSTPSDVSLIQPEPESSATTSSEQEEPAEERAARFAALLTQAERAPDQQQHIVLFGTFLKHGMGSYDDMDMQQAKPKRPPTILASDAATPTPSPSMESGGRRRARSVDAPSPSPSTAPASIIASLKDRKPVLLEGTLMKCSGRSSFFGMSAGWQRRWFILSGRLLIYTSQEGSRDVKRMIDLERIDVITDLQKLLQSYPAAPTPHCIGIRETGEANVLVLCAPTYQDILEWYRAIVLNAALLCQANRLPSKSKPPSDRTIRPISPEEQRKRFLESKSQKFKDELPAVPQPQLEWFYPKWQKPKSYYDLLGVPPDATSGMIKKAYYRIARESHPDRSKRALDDSSTLPLASGDFADIALAYETLIEPAKRSEYDLAERIKEELRNGIDCDYLEPRWRDVDLTIEPRLRQIRQCVVRRVTIFCDGELKCLYWQPAAAASAVSPEAPMEPLMPSAERCFEMRFVQQILYFRDGPVDLGDDEPPEYEGETKFFIIGDRLHTGPFLLQMANDVQCSDLVRGLRIARCEKSTLFKQKMDANTADGIM